MWPSQQNLHWQWTSTSDEFEQFLQYQHIDHTMSSPPFHQSNSFIEQQVKMLKTTLSASQYARISLEYVLLDLQSIPIGPKMPSSREILPNRMINTHADHQPQSIWKLSWTTWLQKRKPKSIILTGHTNANLLSHLGPGQEVLFPSPANQCLYVPGTITDRSSTPCSYNIKTQGKRYHRCREHICRIQEDIFTSKPTPAAEPQTPLSQPHTHSPVPYRESPNDMWLYPQTAISPSCDDSNLLSLTPHHSLVTLQQWSVASSITFLP